MTDTDIRGINEESQEMELRCRRFCKDGEWQGW